ncbi:unnamed protein product [Durusdinium trenchii]|uniref:Uncharacterized protein n=1 Tax=Durusdinium trenchii TaxID=1381693 RepID=A0ABP0LSZ1_9DINO
MSAKKSIQERFRRGEFEEGKFTQCGVQVEQHSDNSFSLLQEKYMTHTVSVPLSSERRKQRKEPTTDKEKKALRGVLGALSWHCNQVAFRFSAYVSLFLSEIANSTVETIIQVNALIHRMKDSSKEPMRIYPFDLNRVSLFAWSTAVDAEDILFLLRYQWSEMQGHEPHIRDPDSMARLTAGTLITDSRSVYDKLQRPYISPTGQSKKIDIELLALKNAQRETGLEIRWVNSQAMLANSLTKRGEDEQMNRFALESQEVEDVIRSKRSKPKDIEADKGKLGVWQAAGWVSHVRLRRLWAKETEREEGEAQSSEHRTCATEDGNWRYQRGQPSVDGHVKRRGPVGV